MAPPLMLRDAPLIIPFTFPPSAVPLPPSPSPTSSVEHYPSPICAPRPTVVASYGLSSSAPASAQAESSTAHSRRRGLVIGTDDGTLWILPCDDQDRARREERGRSTTSLDAHPALPEITTTTSDLPPLPSSTLPADAPISPTPSTGQRFPRSSRLQSRSSSPKPTGPGSLHPSSHHPPPTRNRLVSTSTVASNHTASSSLSNPNLLSSLPSSSSSSSVAANKSRIVSGLSATVAAPPTLTPGEETLGERKDDLRDLLEQGNGRRGRNGGSLSSILSGGDRKTSSIGTAATSLEDVLESSRRPISPTQPGSQGQHSISQLPPISSTSSNRSSFSSLRRPSVAPAEFSTPLSPLSPALDDFVKLSHSPTTKPVGGLASLAHPSSSRQSLSSLKGQDAPAPPLALPPSAVPFGSPSDEGRVPWSKKPVHILPGQGIGEGRGVTALEVVEDRGWVVCLQASGYLSIFSLSDGLCLSAVQIPPAAGSSAWTFVWSGLAIIDTASACRAILVGSAASPSWEPPASPPDGPSKPRSSRLVVLDLDAMDILPSTGTSELPFAVSSAHVIGKQDAPLLLLTSIERSQPHHLVPYALEPPPSDSPGPLPANTSSRTSPNPAAQPGPGSTTQSTVPTELSAKHVTDAFKDLFSRASSSRANKTSAAGLAGQGTVAGGWSVRWGEAEPLQGAAVGSDTTSTGEEVKTLRMGEGRWVDWLGDGGVEIWDVVVLDGRTKSRQTVARLELDGLLSLVVHEGDKGLVTRTKDELATWSLDASDPNGEQTADPGVILHHLVKSPLVVSSPSLAPRMLPIGFGQTITVDSSATGLVVSLLPSPSATSLTDVASVECCPSPGSATVMIPAGDDFIDQVFVGDDQGRLSRTSITSILSPTALSQPPSDPGLALEGSITCLVRAANSRTGTKHVAGGADDGSVGVWDAGSLALQGRWSMFTSPVVSLTMLSERTAGHARGCLLCVAEDGTIGLIVLDGLELLYLLPGTRAPLCAIHVGEESILLVYANEQARLWDLRTQELRRSMPASQARELIQHGGWMEIHVDFKLDTTSLDTVSSLPMLVSSRSADAAFTLLLDIRALHTLLAPDAKVKAQAAEEAQLLPEEVASPGPVKTLRPLVPLLSALITWGLDKEMDTRCEDGLGLVRGNPGAVGVGLRGAGGSVSISREDDPMRVWKTSPAHTGFRSLAIVSLLQMYLSVDTYEAAASEVISFYAARLEDTVGDGFQVATLAFYAEYWTHSSPEIRQAARVLFGSVLAQTPDDEILAVVERCQSELPACQPEADKNTEAAARALILIGQIAVENHSLFTPSLLRDVSTSITFYLHSDDSPYRHLAIDLCSSGFQIWQHYVDAMEILRSLFRLATLKLPASTSSAGSSVAAQARHATLQIASSNTPLFMTTLSFDILNASSPAQRNATMKLVAFMAKRRPLVLYASLARIAEAVVKSLDPNVSGGVLRDAVQQTATVILDSLVSTFPSIDFHGRSQKLAVGTHEGAVILYDLKTATRLFVLEGHKHKITACSFSPDGRRVATVSLDESRVVVWKVGLSFNSLFNVGTPPRQGGPKPGDPYKTYDFNIGLEGNMTTAASLEWVRFEWPGDRTARLRIRETALTFAA